MGWSRRFDSVHREREEGTLTSVSETGSDSIPSGVKRQPIPSGGEGQLGALLGALDWFVRELAVWLILVTSAMVQPFQRH